MAREFTFGAGPERLRRLLFEGLEESEEQQDVTKSLSDDTTISGSEWIGRYRLVNTLGEGGMGIVYLAEQVEPIRRKVALKVIKPGMDSKRVLARFEVERQALALLDHPNIAHVYDAGTTEAGRPFFVMECVKGLPITEHSDRHKLTIEERLRLFQQVCQAVQHAHQKGIIHRDIKPSNILVSTHDDQAVPKIIDFGVAKALARPLTERTLATEDSQILGTPEYMSPEQADMANVDIDTRSDVYSLGVLLYVLLTGILPFDSDTLREGGIEHIRQVIRETDPKTPSTRLNTVSGEDSTKLARLRRTDVRTLGRQLHGDLDWITLKAMEKDRTRRYQTAHAFAEDIQRHLNNEPVLAGPPSKIYRLKKFFQKHRTQAIGAAIAVILIAVIAVVSVMYIQAASRNKEAEALQHNNILAKAQEFRSMGNSKEALAQIDAIINSKHVGSEARLLRAQIILKDEGPAEAISPLEELTKKRDEIAWQAHFLLARIYLETKLGSPEGVSEYQKKGRAHQRAGEELFSKSPEAYFNRSMMAGTVKKSLKYLEEALALDPRHYPSRKARTLTYYVLRDYRNMEREAVWMTALRDWDPLGHSLLAIALRETGNFADAIEHHARAIEISREDPELHDQRRQTYMRMGNYEQALADARECMRLDPNEDSHRFHTFCALVALGRFEAARADYWDSQFERDAARYVFDTLGAGQSWHPPGNRPTGAAFLPMFGAEEDYRQLAMKGKRIVSGGHAPTWSPDGTKVAYSRRGYSGIEIVDVNTGETELLTVPGLDPSWSPDGRYIAYVRDQSVMLLADLATTEVWRQPRDDQREVWLIKADGTEEPRFLTRGQWPSWGRDSERVYYWWTGSKRIYSISIEEGSEPEEIAPCWSGSPAIWLEDNDAKYIAYTAWRSPVIHVVGVSSRSRIAGWAGFRRTLFADWSPDGGKLSVAGGYHYDEGLWVYDMRAGEASRFLSGKIMRGRWSRDGKQMVFALGPPYVEIWLADTELLMPGLTLDEHCLERVRRFTSRIQADPNFPDNYISRAIFNSYLGKREEVLDDLKRYGDLIKDLSSEASMYGYVAWHVVRRHQEVDNPGIAVELLRRARDMQPDNWSHVCGLGAALYYAGQSEKAIAELVIAREMTDGDNATTYLFLAMAHWQSDDQASAREWYGKAIEWIEDSDPKWGDSAWTRIYEAYLEASELMGIELREF